MGITALPLTPSAFWQGIRKKLGSSIQVSYAQGCVVTEGHPTGWQDRQIIPTDPKQFVLGSEALAFWNEEMQRVVAPGLFDVMVGGNSQDLIKTVLEVVRR